MARGIMRLGSLGGRRTVRLRKQQRGAAKPPAEDIGLEHPPGGQGLESLISQFMPDPEAAAEAVRNWTPSRRGNSPHHS
jgi:hypothetical protein